MRPEGLVISHQHLPMYDEEYHEPVDSLLYASKQDAKAHKLVHVKIIQITGRRQSRITILDIDHIRMAISNACPIAIN